MLSISNGKVIKTMSQETGRITMTMSGGEISINNLTVVIDAILTNVVMSSIGKYLPVPGNLHFVVGNNSTFNVRSVLKLLPGSQIKVEQGGTLNIMSNGKIIVLNNNEYSYSNNTTKYPAGTDYANTGYYGYGTSKSTETLKYHLTDSQLR